MHNSSHFRKDFHGMHKIFFFFLSEKTKRMVHIFKLAWRDIYLTYGTEQEMVKGRKQIENKTSISSIFLSLIFLFLSLSHFLGGFPWGTVEKETGQGGRKGE